jgi:hypothetical protein
MSNGSTGWQTLPPTQAWPLEKRREDMRREIARAAREDRLPLVRPPLFAATYGVLPSEVEAELMRHLSEGDCGK